MFWETVTIPENMDVTHSMVLDNRRISIKRAAETVEISQQRVGYIKKNSMALRLSDRHRGYIIHEILDMRKLSAKQDPKYLNTAHKHD
jgi:chromosome segregation and condensation protein ScpB